MKIKTLACTLLLAFAGSPLIGMANDNPAISQNALSADYTRNLRDMIEASLVFEALRREAPAPNASVMEKQFVALFVRQMTREDLNRRMVPALAKVINPGLAAQVAKQMNIPVFRKREARALGILGGVEYFTNAEMAELRGIDGSPAIREYMMLKPKVREAVQSTIRGWSEDFAAQLNNKAYDAIRQVDKDLLAARDAHEGRTIKIGSIGFEPWDQLIYAIGHSMIKFSNAFLHLENSLKQLHYEEYFRAENLTSRKHLDNANAVIDQAEVALETTLKEFNDAIKEREDSVAKSAFASKPEFRKDMDEGLGKLYAYAGDYSESARNMLAQHRQLIAFMQARVDKVSLKDGTLIFATEEERKQAQDIFDKLDSARTALQEVIARQKGSENDTMRKLRAEAEKRHG